jgi:hypothetical protein
LAILGGFPSDMDGGKPLPQGEEANCRNGGMVKLLLTIS